AIAVRAGHLRLAPLPALGHLLGGDVLPRVRLRLPRPGARRGGPLPLDHGLALRPGTTPGRGRSLLDPGTERCRTPGIKPTTPAGASPTKGWSGSSTRRPASAS